MTPEERDIVETALDWSATKDDRRLIDLIQACNGYREANASKEDDPRWVPATFLMCLAGDRIRVGGEGGQETDVFRSSSGVWHVNNADAWHPTPWVHTELRMDLAANPGFQQYPPDTACEILMSAERYAVHLFMQTFPGTQVS